MTLSVEKFQKIERQCSKGQRYWGKCRERWKQTHRGWKKDWKMEDFKQQWEQLLVDD